MLEVFVFRVRNPCSGNGAWPNQRLTVALMQDGANVSKLPSLSSSDPVRVTALAQPTMAWTLTKLWLACFLTCRTIAGQLLRRGGHGLI